MLKSLKETFQIVYSGLLNCSITSFGYLLKGRLCYFSNFTFAK